MWNLAEGALGSLTAANSRQTNCVVPYFASTVDSPKFAPRARNRKSRLDGDVALS
jgi:hypothetical protein